MSLPPTPPRLHSLKYSQGVGNLSEMLRCRSPSVLCRIQCLSFGLCSLSICRLLFFIFSCNVGFPGKFPQVYNSCPWLETPFKARHDSQASGVGEWLLRCGNVWHSSPPSKSGSGRRSAYIWRRSERFSKPSGCQPPGGTNIYISNREVGDHNLKKSRWLAVLFFL